jgi:hypothetical protein
LDPPPGINSDATATATRGEWSDGNNMRFRNGRAQPIGNLGAGGTSAGLSTACRDIFGFTRSGADVLVFGGASGANSLMLTSSVGVAPSNRTPAGTPSGSGWSFAAWGDTLLGALRGGTLYEQSGSGVATEITQAPDRIDAGILVTPERQVLAFSCNEETSGTHNPRCIRGCDLEDYTDWTTSASNNAFEHILDGPGAIVSAHQVGPYVAVLTTTTLFLGRFIGDPSQTYRFDKVADIIAPISPRAAVELAGTLYWMGHDFQLWAWLPGSEPTPIPSTVGVELRANAAAGASQTYAVLIPNSQWQEIWCFYHDQRDGSGYADRYVAYSVPESRLAGRPVWFRGQLSVQAIHEAKILRDGSKNTMVGVNPNGEMYLYDTDGTAIGLNSSLGSPASPFVQSGSFYLDGANRRVMIKRVRPDVKLLSSSTTGVGTVTLYLRDYPAGDAREYGPTAGRPMEVGFRSGDGVEKLSVRASGKLVAIKFMPTENSAVAFGKLLFDIVPMGER